MFYSKIKFMSSHLKDAQMSYFDHAIRSLRFSAWSLCMFFICFLHAIFPFLFTDTFSNSINAQFKNLEEEKNNGKN